MTIDTLAFINSAMDNIEKVGESYALGTAASDEYIASGQKGLDYSNEDPAPVIWTPSPHGQENMIDVIPFLVTQPWYEELLCAPPTQEQRAAGQKYAAKKGIKLQNGMAMDGYLEIPFHRFADGDSGDAVCLREAFGKQCPHCERMFEEYVNRNNGDPKAEAIAKALGISWRTFFNIYNYNYAQNPNAPEGHDGYEIIDDFGRGSLLKNILSCAKNTQAGEVFVYPWVHPTQGYSLKFDSIWKPPTSAKFKKGHWDFPIIKFAERPQQTDYRNDIEQSVRFDKLVDRLIYSYDEMVVMLNKKLEKLGVVSQDSINSTGMQEQANIDNKSEHKINEHLAPGVANDCENESAITSVANHERVIRTTQEPQKQEAVDQIPPSTTSRRRRR